MRHLLATLLVTTLAVACGGDSGDTDARDVKEELGEAAKATKEYLTEKKDEFLSSIEDGMGSLEDDLARLREKAEEAGGETKEKTQEVLADLEGRKAELGRQLEDARKASAEAWDDAKADLSADWKSLKQDVADALDESGS